MKSFAIKFYSFLAILLVSMGCLSIQSCKHDGARVGDHMSLTKFMTMFSDSTAFAIVDMGDTPVLLVSNETYINKDKEQNVVLNAIAAQVYMLDDEDKVISLGEIRSQGTLYPISLDGKVLMSAGHRFVNCFEAQDSTPSLQLVETMQGQVIGTDVVTYAYENRLTNVFENDKDESSFEQMMERFEGAEPVVFQKEIRSMSLWNRRR